VTTRDHDVIVVGSGFGGSVAALRLSEKRYRVGVMESGRRWQPEDLPRTSWDVRRFLWMPRLGFRGIQRITLLRDVLVLTGAGVGGGSLVYGNTLYEPTERFFDDPTWSSITDWADELRPHFDQARRMLGVTQNPFTTAADRALRTVADGLGVGDTFRPTPIGVHIGRAGETVPDPYFGGAGPERTGCIACGECMTGCRHGAKNTLDVNYLHLAEGLGAQVHAEHEVVDVAPSGDGGWIVTTSRPGFPGRRRRDWTADHVVFAAGALGTQRLLHTLRARDRLPHLSPRLGELTRTNSEALLGVDARGTEVDYSRGVAITSSMHPDADTHIEPVRYGRGSNAMGLLSTIMVDGGGRIPRPLRFVGRVLRHPRSLLRSLSVRRWSERTIILLVMQTLDNSLRVTLRRGLLGPRLTSEPDHGAPNPTWIPIGHEVARRVADEVGGDPVGSILEAVLDVPTTAHLIGGCPIGNDVAAGVIDAYHRVHGHPGLHVCDGTAITANLGVNPSLTITAMAERAMALWPNRGDVDPRPEPGEPYRRIATVAPRRPAVPADAPGALRLPIVDAT